MIQEGLWEAVPTNEKEQWSQRFYNNKAAVRVARQSDDEIRSWIEAYVERRRSGKTGTGRSIESPEDFLARTQTFRTVPLSDEVALELESELDEDVELQAMIDADEVEDPEDEEAE